MKKKIKLTEDQFERLKPTLVEVSDDKYVREVKVWFVINGEIFPDKEVSELSVDKMKISYMIDLGYKSWGINGANVYGFNGPTTLDVNVEYYVNEDGDTDVMTVPLVMDWSKVSVRKNKGEGIIGIGDEVDIYVYGGNDGKLYSRGINVDVYTI
jgi:hypothetical protein